MKTFTAVILDQDGTIREVEYAEKDSYRTMSAAVGGLIESVDWMGFGMDAYANEEGLYTPGLSVNPHAARVYPKHQRILGNIVLPKMTPTKRARLIKKGFAVNPE